MQNCKGEIELKLKRHDLSKYFARHVVLYLGKRGRRKTVGDLR